MFQKLFVQFFVLGALTLSGCSGKAVIEQENPAAAAEEQALPDGSPKLQPVDLGAAEPAHRVGQVYLAGQPDEEDVPGLKAKGIKTVVSLRTDGEVSWDEKSAVEAAGMKYVNVPFLSDEELTDEVFDQVRAVLRDKQQQPVLLHCGAAVRVGAVWMAHRVLDDGLGIEEALKEAKEAGLRSAGYQRKAEEYIERNR